MINPEKIKEITLDFKSQSPKIILILDAANNKTLTFGTNSSTPNRLISNMQHSSGACVTIEDHDGKVSYASIPNFIFYPFLLSMKEMFVDRTNPIATLSKEDSPEYLDHAISYINDSLMPVLKGDQAFLSVLNEQGLISPKNSPEMNLTN